MFGLPLAFAAPAVLAALVGLVGLYFLLRVTPPSPRRAIFPPLRLLVGLDPNETTPARTPWPILALRLAIGALIILAMAEPLWNTFAGLSGSAPLLVLIDDGFAAAPDWDKRIDFARERAAAAERSGRVVTVAALSQGGKDIAPSDRSGLDGQLRSLAPVPYAPDRAGAIAAIERFLAREPRTDIVWIADGVELGGASAFSTRLASIAHSVEVVTDGRGALALAGVREDAVAHLVRQVEPLGDHGQDEVTWPRGPGGDEGVEAEATDHRQNRFDMAMRPRAEDAKGVGGGDEGLPLERAADQVNDRDREVGEVSEGLMLDLAVLSKGASEIVTGVGHPLDGVGDFSNVDCSRFASHTS